MADMRKRSNTYRRCRRREDGLYRGNRFIYVGLCAVLKV